MLDTEKMTFILDQRIVEVKVVQTNNKNMYLKVIDNEIVLLLPPRAKEKTAREFVAKHLPKFTNYVDKKKQIQYYDITQKWCMLFGKKQKFEVLSNWAKNTYTLKQTKLYLQTKSFAEDDVKAALLEMLITELTTFLTTEISKQEKLLNLPVHTFKVSDKESAWGTNFINKHKLTFALKLAHFPKEVIAYVVTHELVHDLHANHSSSFWDAVKLYCPDYEKHKKSLKDTEMSEE